MGLNSTTLKGERKCKFWHLPTSKLTINGQTEKSFSVGASIKQEDGWKRNKNPEVKP